MCGRWDERFSLVNIRHSSAATGRGCIDRETVLVLNSQRATL